MCLYTSVQGIVHRISVAFEVFIRAYSIILIRMNRSKWEHFPCSNGMNLLHTLLWVFFFSVSCSGWMRQWCSVAVPGFMLVWTQKSLACPASVRPPTLSSLTSAGCHPGLYVTLCQLATAAACRWGQELYMQMDSTYNWPQTDYSSMIN